MVEALLSIDYGHTTVCAVVRGPDGRVGPVALDGSSVSPTGVAVNAAGGLLVGRAAAEYATRHPQSYIRTPGQRLLEDHITVGSVQADPVDLLTATLSMVAREARNMTTAAPDEVVISIPAGWVTRQRRAIQTAAARAGFDKPPRLVSGAESIVRERMGRGASVPVGGIAVVCRLDATAGELVILRHQSNGFEIVAAIDLGEVGEIPGATMTDQAGTALAQALDAASIQDSQIGAVFCQAPATMTRDLSEALAASVPLPVEPTLVPDLAAAFGGAGPAQPDPTPVSAARTRGGMARSAIALSIAWTGAAALTYQMFSSATAYPNPSTTGKFLQTQMYAWGLVPVLAILGAVSAALLLSHTRPVVVSGADPALGSAVVLVAVLGLGGAAALSLIGAQHFGADPAPLLQWTMLSTAPLSVVLIGLGRMVARAGPPTSPSAADPAPWRDRLTFPVEALVLVALSTVAIVASLVGVPSMDSSLWWKMQHVGAYALGWGVAFLLPVTPWRRVTVGFLLAAAATYAVGLQTIGVISSCMVAAITLWWMLRLLPALAQLFGRRPNEV